MQVKLFIFALFWSLTLGCKTSPSPSRPPPIRLKDNCEYCPECARVSTGHIGGVPNFATITNVSTGCPKDYFFSTQIDNDNSFLVPMDGKFRVLKKWQLVPLLRRSRHF